MSRWRRDRDSSSELFPGFTDVVEIGVGSIATVYRAREQNTNRQVALKLLNIRDVSPRALESFERESVALGAVSSHPNIVTLYRILQTPDRRPVLVLELCEGSVGDQTREGAGLPAREAVAIAIKTAGALETAHRAGILHRDVKPQNILITEFGEPALADFGVAMLQSSTQTTAGLFDFTTLHVAPELLEGGATSAATDVYELASSLYQLVAGRSAFRAFDGESPASVILRILRDPVRPVQVADVPVALSDLLIRAMSKDQDQRPPTAAEFAAELGRIEAAQGWPATPLLVREAPRVVPAAAARPGARPAAGGRGLVPQPPPFDRPPPAEPEAPPEPAAAAESPAEPEPADAAEPPPEPEPPPARPKRTVAATRPIARPDVPPRPPDPQPPAPDAPSPEPDLAQPPQPDQAQFPIPPTGLSAPAQPPEDPVSALRARVQPPVRDPHGTRGATPLRPSVRVARGLGSSLVLDETTISARTGLRRWQVPWTDVLGFEPRFDAAANGQPQRGWLVVITTQGELALPGTHGPVSEVRDTHALLDAYREQAQGGHRQ